MSKLRSNSHWARLGKAQREAVEGWLFDEHISYSEARDRVKAQFGLEVSIAGVCRFYKARASERQMTDLLAAQVFADNLSGAKLNPESLRSAAVKLVAKTTLNLACEKPDEWKSLGALTKILLLSENNEIRQRHLELEQNRFRHKSCGDLSEEIPILARLLVTIEEDDSLSEEQKIERVQALLFPGPAGFTPCAPAETSQPNET